MSIITTSNFHSDLLPLVKVWFGNSYDMLPTYFDKMLKVEKPDDRAYQVDALVSGLGTLQQKSEGSSLIYDISKESFKPKYLHTTYSLGFQISMEMIQDGDAFRNAKIFTEMLKFSAMQTREILAANIFNNGFSGSYLMDGGDGVALISASHPTRSGNQSNLITGGSVDISEAALEQIHIDIRNMKNDRGLRINALPDKLIVSTSDAPTAHRILDNPNRPATADRDINYLNNNSIIPGGIIANPFLTDSDAFFVTTNIPQGLKFLDRLSPTIDESNDFDTKNGKYSVVMRCSQGWSDWRGVVGSAGA